MPALIVGSTWDGRPVGPDERVTVSLSLRESHLLVEIDAPFHDDPPPPAPAGPTDRLWEHEVVELFVVGDGNRYTEIELGPHGNYLVLRLEGVRNPVESGLDLEYYSRVDGSRWEGATRLPLSLLPPAPWRVNAYAIHGRDEARRHLAATPVPGPAPDFHRIELFEPYATT